MYFIQDVGFCVLLVRVSHPIASIPYAKGNVTVLGISGKQKVSLVPLICLHVAVYVVPVLKSLSWQDQGCQFQGTILACYVAPRVSATLRVIKAHLLLSWKKGKTVYIIDNQNQIENYLFEHLLLKIQSIVDIPAHSLPGGIIHYELQCQQFHSLQ